MVSLSRALSLFNDSTICGALFRQFRHVGVDPLHHFHHHRTISHGDGIQHRADWAVERVIEIVGASQDLPLTLPLERCGGLRFQPHRLRGLGEISAIGFRGIRQFRRFVAHHFGEPDIDHGVVDLALHFFEGRRMRRHNGRNFGHRNFVGAW